MREGPHGPHSTKVVHRQIHEIATLDTTAKSGSSGLQVGTHIDSSQLLTQECLPKDFAMNAAY